jgi:hypothetical protein
MGHDHHFLSRLDRVSPEECELALGLYRDPEVVKKLLDHARLPDMDGRVAISMDHPVDGPFIIVARNGHFVTCLGKGMHVSNLPLVTRSELDTIATKVHTLRDQLKRAREVAPTDSELAKLMKRVGKAGHAMPQEDFAALALWAPMMWGKYLLGFLEAYEAMEKQRIELLIYQGYKETDEVLEAYWRSVFGMGHLALLATLGEPEVWKEVGRFLLQAKTTYTRPLVEQRLMPFAIKIPWIAGHIGEPLLDSYERALLDGEGKNRGYDAILGLAGIFAAKEELRPRIQVIFDEGKKRWSDAPDVDLKWRSELIVGVEQLLPGSEFLTESLKMGAKMIVDAREELAKDSEYRYEKLEDVPPTVSFAVIANTTIDWNDSVLPMFPLSFLPFVPLLEAEDYYVPRGLTRGVTLPWNRNMTIELLSRPGKGVTRSQPVRANDKPGRNDPCSCGSGKKYKKCHGA